MKLSIIIPAYNAAKYVERCVESILSQDFNDLEILIVDDGSSDNTLDVCTQLAMRGGVDRYLVIRVLHKQNGGVSSARNYGISEANGDYLMFIDVDDYLLPDTLKKAVDVADNNPNADFCVFGFKRIARSGSTSKSTPESKRYSKNETLKYIKNTDALLLGTPWAKLYNRCFIESGDFKFDTKRKLFEDICFNLSCLSSCNSFVTSDICVYCYEVNNQSATAKFNGETLIDDANNYMSVMRKVVSDISKSDNNPVDNLSNDIISSTQITICHNALYDIYNLYKQKRNKDVKKLSWMKRLVGFMSEIKPDWQNAFTSGFPRIFATAYQIHPRCADLLLRITFAIKR